MKSAFLNLLFSIIYRKWLWDGDRRLKVLQVKGWRTALVENRFGSRKTTTPCFKLLWMKFD